jgi:hypothetical protein
MTLIEAHVEDEMTELDASYYEEDGWRKITPYYYLYEAYAKERWFGKTLLDVFTTEFRDQEASYYVFTCIYDVKG